LSYNYLTGNIPPTIFNLTNLTMLNMSNNYLEGTISPSLCHLAHLEVFDVRSNQIQGVLPSCLGEYTNFDQITKIVTNCIFKFNQE
jgi:Leucine-rich repeat (LRR) protein